MTTLVLLALTPESQARLLAGVARRADASEMLVTLVSPPIAAAVEAARAEHGSLPLGVAARAADEAIEAIEAGADEALVVETDAAVQDLLDRARLRGRSRHSDEQAKVAVAHADKLAALGTLVAGVAHEINNPLAGLTLTLDVLPEELASAQRLAEEIVRARDEGRGLSADEVVTIAADASTFLVSDVHAQIAEMTTIAETMVGVVRDLRAFSRTDDGEAAQVVEIVNIVDPVLRLVGRELTAAAVLERDYERNLPPVLVPRGRLTQVLTNVLVNATHAIRDVQRDKHRVRVTIRADEDAVAISIADSGPGIAPEVLSRIFDPFFTTKRARLGTGLGLSISRNLMRRMGGDLLVESVFGEGATFIILVPRPSAEEIAAARPPPRRSILRTSEARRSVLVVDDDEVLVRAYARVLGRRYDVLVAGDGQEAIDMLASGSRADVVLASLAHSSHDGAHLLRWLDETGSPLAARTVLVSSTSEMGPERALLEKYKTLVADKPVSAARLLELLERAGNR